MLRGVFVLLCLVAAAVTLACAGMYNGPASGIWTAVTQLETCKECETRLAFDLRENAQGLVAGVVGTHSRSEVEYLSGAAWVSGLRVGDSLLLTFSPACHSNDPRIAQGFRGLLESGGLLKGTLWGREAGILRYSFDVTLQRGTIDSLVLETFEDLRTIECEH